MRVVRWAALAIAIVGGYLGLAGGSVSATPLSASALSGIASENPLFQQSQYRRRYYRSYRGYRPAYRRYRPVYRSYRPVYRPYRRVVRPYRGYRPVYRPYRPVYRPYRGYRPVVRFRF
jgi:hypothetical protein